MSIDRDFTLGTLQELIRIDSRNPSLEAGAPGEWELAQVVHLLLGELGWEAEIHTLREGRANVVSTRRGTRQGPSLMINVHLDTVGVKGMEDPFSGEHREGRVWGRGAQDTKGGMAAVLGAAKALTDNAVELDGDLVLAFVADEEQDSIGTEDLVQRVKTDAAIVIEPSDLDVCIAHRGFGVFRLRTRGCAAHGGRSDLGVDANMHMSRVLVALDRLRHAWQKEHRHAILGSANLHVPLISGGSQLYTYAEECMVDLECRTVPGQSLLGVQRELQAILDDLHGRMDHFLGDVMLTIWRNPYEIDPERPIVHKVLGAVEAVRGQPARLIGHGWWEDAALLADAGMETVVLGPRGEGMHTQSEWVDAYSVIDLAEILYMAAQSYCKV